MRFPIWLVFTKLGKFLSASASTWLFLAHNRFCLHSSYKCGRILRAKAVLDLNNPCQSRGWIVPSGNPHGRTKHLFSTNMCWIWSIKKTWIRARFKTISCSWALVMHAFNPSTGEAGTGIFVSLRPTWSTKPGLLHREALSQNTLKEEGEKNEQNH